MNWSIVSSSSTSSSSSSLQHLDATLFYSTSAQRSDHTIDLPASLSAQHRYDDDHRYNVDATAAQPPASSYPVLALSDVTDGVDADLLRVVLLLSDLVVFVYRLTSTYVTVRAIRRRGSAATRSSCQRVVSGQLTMDGGDSTLRSSSSRTVLTSTSTSASVPRAVPDTSNIYSDPQSLLADNCAAGTILSSECSSGDLKHLQSGQQPLPPFGIHPHFRY